MLVKLGFNTDYGMDKFDVGLDETDLARILADAGIPPDAPLASVEVFQVLHLEAEWLCAGKRSTVTEGSEAEHWKAEAQRLGAKRRVQLERIEARLGRVPA
jgi:hypothetical protein